MYSLSALIKINLNFIPLTLQERDDSLTLKVLHLPLSCLCHVYSLNLYALWYQQIKISVKRHRKNLLSIHVYSNTFLFKNRYVRRLELQTPSFSTRCNNCIFILRNGFTLHVSGDNLTHHQEYICCIWPKVSRLT